MCKPTTDTSEAMPKALHKHNTTDAQEPGANPQGLPNRGNDLPVNLAEGQPKALHKPTTTLNGPMTTLMRSYLTTALWSSNDEDDLSLERYAIRDISDALMEGSRRDCESFCAQHADDLNRGGLDQEQIGQALWLSRNGHGAGFFDAHPTKVCAAYGREQAIAVVSRDFSKRDALDATCNCPYHACQRLQAAAGKLGEVNLYVHDGQVYAPGY